MSDLIDRQQAIDIVRNRVKRFTTACVLAVTEIEQLPSAQPEKRTDKRTETHECDLISRQQAIEAFEPEHDTDWYTPRIIEVLEALPPVQPEPSQVARDICTILENEQDMRVILKNAQSDRKTGKWIGYKAEDKDWQRNDGSPIFLSCSECNETVMNNGSAHWNYCPSCGARMEGKEHD